MSNHQLVVLTIFLASISLVFVTIKEIRRSRKRRADNLIRACVQHISAKPKGPAKDGRTYL